MQSPIHLCLDIVVSIWCCCLSAVSSSGCDVFFYMIFYTYLSRCCCLSAMSSSMQSPIYLYLGYFFYGNHLYVFLMVFLWYLLMVSLSGYLPLRRSSTCFCLGVFHYDNLLHVFVLISSITEISYMSSATTLQKVINFFKLVSCLIIMFMALSQSFTSIQWHRKGQKWPVQH